MTWGETYKDKKHNHSVAVAQLIKVARDRLTPRNMDDLDELFRFRLTGAQRVWGVREGRVSRLLWWDPAHEICPTTE